MTTFAPGSVTIPSGIETIDFRVRMLAIDVAIMDYDAVMSSAEHLKGVFGPNDSWPAGLTLEKNRVDLARHQKEFEQRKSFAFTVMSPDESRCLGCVYIDPSEKLGYDATAVLWVRQSELQNGLDEKLYSTIKTWLSEDWWFSAVAFPGRELSWKQWASLLDLK